MIEKKKIGIIGGVGSLATVDIFNKIVENTFAENDQENIPVLIYNNPKIPDRTKSILHDGESPVEEIVNTGKILEKMGADLLCIPCNTAHYYFNILENSFNVPLLNMIDITVDYVKEKKYKKVCVLGTEGTIKSKIYHNKLLENNIENYIFDNKFLDRLTFIIYDVVKKNNFNIGIGDFENLLKDMANKNDIDVFILGCTELPVVFERFNIDVNYVDPTLLLAKKLISLVRN
ncbi:aspartate/glutamate racemase family protein [Helcococcus kunzii]|uniref:aspartate/glutamate racemase family protein n=1 Tax=Helcococcus kunzii TaxID=40091 RepID=UPI0024ADD11F|nr:amino acid racemase [Helcococcus kunzii]